MANYTYDDFVKRAQQAGMIDQFSSYDLDLARQYPEFGLSMLSLKQNYAGANTEQARLLANEEANRLRSSYGNYTGGRDGSLYISNGLSPSSFRSGYEDALDEAVRELSGYGGFDFTGTAPSYQNRYQEQMDSLLGEVSNPQPFDYDQATDPVWSAYKKQYRREGQRAAANAMAQAAAATGGVPSSYAVTAGQQAGDYYASQLSDALPSLYEQAYNRYLQEYAQKQQALSAVTAAEQNDYNKYLNELNQYNTDRALAYNEWQDLYNMRLNSLNAMQGREDTLYSRALDQINYDANLRSQAQEQTTQAQSQARETVDAILAAGGVPSAELVAASGYPQEYIDTLAAYYAQQAAAASYSGGYGGGSGSTGTEEDAQTVSLFQAMRDSGSPFEYLLGQGVTSAAQLDLYMDQYEAWLANGGGSSVSVDAGAFNDDQYNQFINELSTTTSAETFLNLLEMAQTRGKISLAQARALAKKYGKRFHISL